MPQLSPDQLDDILDRAGVKVLQDRANPVNPGLDPRLGLLHQLNEELSRDGGQAGTHAYDMMAAVEEINTGNTRVLIELIAAVVMLKRNDNPLLDQMSVTFQPSDIDDMQRNYALGVKRDGMHVTVTLTRKAEPSDSWQLSEDEDGTGAKEQAQQAPERPVWAIRDGAGGLHGFPDKGRAREALRQAYDQDAGAHLENRYCLHPDCPSTRCNHPEATSAS